MKQELAAAYYQAGIAVVAHHSKYHRVIGDITLLNFGSGETFISLSRSKCIENGMPPHEESKNDPDVSKDLAIILSAGTVAEHIGSESDANIKPSKNASGSEYMKAVEKIKNTEHSQKYDFHHANARLELEKHWDSVERLAQLLFKNTTATSEDIDIILNNH
ncbi:hypothetical protein ACO0LG_10985 [Undibacterium sp. Ji42W]|uniref:hypothetical protein n=1 Tax=Undibacterium sp. Ji42W TaxID=3413039 RepID=UPI003BF40B23